MHECVSEHCMATSTRKLIPRKLSQCSGTVLEVLCQTLLREWLMGCMDSWAVTLLLTGLDSVIVFAIVEN